MPLIRKNKTLNALVFALVLLAGVLLVGQFRVTETEAQGQGNNFSGLQKLDSSGQTKLQEYRFESGVSSFDNQTNIKAYEKEREYLEKELEKVQWATIDPKDADSKDAIEAMRLQDKLDEVDHNLSILQNTAGSSHTFSVNPPGGTVSGPGVNAQGGDNLFVPSNAGGGCVGSDCPTFDYQGTTVPFGQNCFGSSCDGGTQAPQFGGPLEFPGGTGSGPFPTFEEYRKDPNLFPEDPNESVDGINFDPKTPVPGEVQDLTNTELTSALNKAEKEYGMVPTEANRDKRDALRKEHWIRLEYYQMVSGQNATALPGDGAFPWQGDPNMSENLTRPLATCVGPDCDDTNPFDFTRVNDDDTDTHQTYYNRSGFDSDGLQNDFLSDSAFFGMCDEATSDYCNLQVQKDFTVGGGAELDIVKTEQTAEFEDQRRNHKKDWYCDDNGNNESDLTCLNNADAPGTSGSVGSGGSGGSGGGGSLTSASFNAQCDVNSGSGAHVVSAGGSTFCSVSGPAPQISSGTANISCTSGSTVTISGTCGATVCRAFVNSVSNLTCPFAAPGFVSGGFGGASGYTGTASVNCTCQ